MNNVERTRAFFDAWERMDIDALVDAADDNIFYHNIPMEPVTGKQAFREGLTPFIGMSEKIIWDTLHIAESSDGVVLTERVDHFHLAGGIKISVRVMGTFEFNSNGKLIKWRDYFDLGEFQSQMPDN